MKRQGAARDHRRGARRAHQDRTPRGLFGLRFQHATGELENTAGLGSAKRDLARALTVARERGIDTEDLIETMADDKTTPRDARGDPAEAAGARGARRGRPPPRRAPSRGLPPSPRPPLSPRLPPRPSGRGRARGRRSPSPSRQQTASERKAAVARAPRQAPRRDPRGAPRGRASSKAAARSRRRAGAREGQGRARPAHGRRGHAARRARPRPAEGAHRHSSSPTRPTRRSPSGSTSARRHRRYEKIVRSSSTLHAHDETNDAHEGDLVRVIESRPLSRTKRWRLVEVLERAK